MRVRVKVCCIASESEARRAIDAGADALGLVAEMPSGPGPIPDGRISEIARTIPPPLATVLLTSRSAPEAVVAHVTETRTNTVQLVDAVPFATYAALRASHPSLRIMQVVHMTGLDALSRARAVAPHVDALILDSGRPGLGQLGGTGRTHDWTLSAQIAREVKVPVFLAGGLRAENVADAIRQVRPFGVDVCSGVRVAGQLSLERVRAFVAAVTNATR